MWALIVVLLCLSGPALWGASTAHAALTLDKSAPPRVLFGNESTVTLNATNDAAGPYGYNLSFRDVLPAGVSYVPGSAQFAGSELVPTVIPNAPITGQTTLLFENVSDISPNATQRITYRVSHATSGAGALAIGDDYVNQATAYANQLPRVVPAFNASGAPQSSPTGMTSATAQASTQISAIKIEKSEPNSEGEIMRGLHDHQTVYTLRVTNNGIHPTTGITVDDYLPAGLEFLGCGTVDHTTSAGTNLGATEEYPGSGPIDAPASRPSGLDPVACRTPVLVETIRTDDSAPQPATLDAGAVYTHVRWTGLGTLQPGETVEIQYVAAVPLRENTINWSTATAKTGGPVPGSTGAQTANLDNNSGPETTDEQSLVNHAIANGIYRGNEANPALRLPVSDETSLSRTAEDLAVAKSVDPDRIAQNGVSEWRLRFRTSEYRRVTGGVATDTLPDGLCPLGGQNFEQTPPTANAECNPVGGRTPSLAYESAVEHADGSWRLTWNLPDMAPSATYDVTFPTRTRRFYQQGFADDTANPVRAGDSWTNTIDVTGDDHRICADGDVACTASPAVPIDGDGPPSRPVIDASSASQTSGGVSIDKTVLDPTGVPTPVSCAAAQSADPDAYVDAPTVPSYGTGDRICWRLRVDFSSSVDTGEPVIRDFFPAGMTYEAGSASPTGRNTLSGVSVDASDAADRVLSWSLADVDTSNQVFEWTFSTIVTSTAIPASAEQTITGNLMKLAYRNTASQTFSLRDRVEAEIVKPIVGLDKRITAISPTGGGTLNSGTGNATNVTAGSTLSYRVRLSNTGDAPAVRTVVWDNLPAGITCADIVPTSISDGGTCGTIPLSTASRITWSPGVAVAADGTKDLTYQVVVPQGLRPAVTLSNTAGVVEYARDTNRGGSETFVPASNIDPTRTVTNAPRADDPATATLRDVTLAKTVVATSVTGAGNHATTQATIGETITYRVAITVPAGATLFGTPKLTDTVDARMELLPGATVTRSGGSAPAPADPTASVSGNLLTVAFGGAYANTASTAAVFTVEFQARVRDVTTPANANRRGETLPNSAVFTWQTNSSAPALSTKTTSTVNVTIVEPNVTVAKRATLPDSPFTDVTEVSAGDTIRYVVTATNLSNASNTNVSVARDSVLADAVPSGLTPLKAGGVPASADGDVIPNSISSGRPGTWSETNRTITWPTLDLGAGTSANYAYNAVVVSPAPAGARYENTVKLTATSLEGTDPSERTASSPYSNGYSSSTTKDVTLSGGQLTKSAATTRRTVGDVIDYTVEYTLPANVEFYDLTVIDTLPDGVDFVAGSSQVECLPSCAFVGSAASPSFVSGTRNATTGKLPVSWFFDEVASSPSERTLRLNYQGRIGTAYTAPGAGGPKAGDTLTNQAAVYYDATDKRFTPPTSPPDPASYDKTSGPKTADVIVREPKLTLDKHVSGIPAGDDIDRRTTQPGDDYTYTVKVTNTGTSPAYDIDIADTPSSKLTNVVATAAGISPAAAATIVDGNGDDGTLAWHVAGPLAPGDTITLTYTADLDDSSALSANETVVNTASVPSYWNASVAERDAAPTGVYREYTTNPPSDTVTLDVRLPNVTVSKTTGVANGSGGYLESASAEVGEPFPWRIVVTNPSPSSTAQDVKVVDVLPAGWSYKPGSATVTPTNPGTTLTGTPASTGNTLTWTGIGDIAPGGQIVLEFTAIPDLESRPNPNPQINRVTVTAKDSDGQSGSADGPYAADDDASANLQLPVLTVAKTPDGANAIAGTTNDYTVVVENTSTTAPARDVVVTDVLEAHQSYVADTATASPATGFSEVAPVVDDGDAADPTDDTTTIGWKIATIPAGGRVTITVPVRVPAGLPAGTTLRNGVSVVSREITTPVTDEGSFLSTVSTDVGVVKTVTAPTANAVPGQNITYSVVATNHGPSVATGVVVSDPLPDELTLVSAPGCAVAPGNERALTCDVGTLAVDGTETFTVTAKVAASATGSVSNTATVTSTTPDGNPANDSSTAPKPLSPRADLVVTKDVSKATVRQGEQFSYEIKVRNDGPSDAVGVSLLDELPDPDVVLVTAGTGTDTGTCIPNSTTNEVFCAIGTLTPGQTATITVVAKAVSVGTFTNVATATSTTDEADEDNDRDTADVDVDPVVDVGIEKTAPATVRADHDLTYTLRLFNEGPSPATGVVVSDTLPDGVTFVSASPGCTYEAPGAPARTVTCQITALPVSSGDPADDPVREITVHVPWALAGATLTNSAAIAAGEHDRNDGNDRSTATTTVDPVAALRVTKVASVTEVFQGGTLTYEVKVRNAGPSAAANVTLEDRLPAGIELAGTAPSTDTGTCTPNATATPSTVSCQLGTLAPDETATITITARAVDVGTHTNVARAATDTDEQNEDDNEDTADVTVKPVANVGIEKTAHATVEANDNLTYTLRLFNDGPSPATGVRVTDELPPGVAFVSASPDCQYVSEDRKVVCERPALAVSGDPADDPRYQITVHVPWALAATTIENTATIEATEEDQTPDDDSSTVPTVVTPAANLQVTKTAPTLPVPQSVSYDYVVTVRNDGPSTAVAAKLHDEMPGGVTALDVATDTGTCKIAANAVDCELGDLAKDATAKVTITARGDVPGTPRNVAVASSDTDDVDLDDNKAEADVEILAASDLAIVKTAPAAVEADAPLTYTLAITNNGPSDATNVTATDVLPPNVDFRSADDGCTIAAGTVTCAVGDLAVGDTAERRITVFVPYATGGQTLTNIATVTATEVDLVPENDSSQATTVVGDVADLVVAKTAGGAVASGQATWTVTVRNDGPSAAQAVRLVDQLPEGTSFRSAQPSVGGCNGSGREIGCDLGTIAAGGSVQVTIVADVAADATGRQLRNSATATSPTADPNEENNTGTADVVVSPAPPTSPDLHVTKVASTAKPELGKRLEYRIEVANRGAIAANDVRLTDTMSSNVVVGKVRATQGRCDAVKSTVTCRLGAIAPGQKVTVVVPVTPTTPGALSNTVSVAAEGQSDEQVLDNRAVANVRVEAKRAAATLTKKASRRSVRGGKTVTYAITVKMGKRAGSDLRVCDRLPRGLAFVRATGARFRQGQACWTIPYLAAGKQRTLRIVARTDRSADARRVTNTAVLIGDNVSRRRASAAVRVSPAIARPGGVTG